MSTLFKSIARPKIEHKFYIKGLIATQIANLMPQFQTLGCVVGDDFSFSCTSATGLFTNKDELLHVIACWHAWRQTDREFNSLKELTGQEVWREYEGWYVVVQNHFRKQGVSVYEDGSERGLEARRSACLMRLKLVFWLLLTWRYIIVLSSNIMHRCFCYNASKVEITD